MFKKTKIVATISDLRCETEFIKSLFDSGMDVVRMNTAHQAIDDTIRVIKNVRAVSPRIPVMLDTKGPEIRTTKVQGEIKLKTGDELRIAGKPERESTRDLVCVTYAHFAKEVPVGTLILIDDGLLEIRVTAIDKDVLVCRVDNDGDIKSKKSVNVPGLSFSLPSLTDKDKAFIDMAITHDVEFIAHSFVRSANDVLEIQEILDARKCRTKIIAKIENQEGVDNIDRILDVAYGVMVARGDLGIEIPMEKIPGIQKMLIEKCVARRKPVIVATQMLQSMITNPRPTRAEVSDIANAVLSKADAIMLSGETASGQYPVEAVQTMARVALEVEKSKEDYHDVPLVTMTTPTSAYLCKAAVEASLRLDAKAIIADTLTGQTVVNMTGFRGKRVIFAMCYDKRVMKELALSYGVYAEFMEPNHQREFVHYSIKNLMTEGFLESEDLVVILGGNFGNAVGATFIEISSAFNLFTMYKRES